MKTPSHRDWAIALCIAIPCLTIGWAVKGIFTPKPVENLPIDISPYTRTIDSLKKINSDKETKILLLKVRVDSVINAKELNHIKLNHNVAKTRTFTPSQSKLYMDSVFSAESGR